MKVSNKDIKKRIHDLNELFYEQAVTSKRPKVPKINHSNISISIETIRECLYNTNTPQSIFEESFNELLNIFDELYNTHGALSSEFDNIYHVLTEAVDRTRTPKEMQALLKRRISLGTKTKGSTKLASKIADHNDAHKQTDIENNLKSLAGNLVSNKIEPAVINVPKPNAASSATSTKEYYQELINKCDILIEVDKIISNYAKLSNRFNVDRVLDSIKNSIPENIDCYCELFDTWPDSVMSQKSKFNVAIHTALFLNEKQNLNIDREILIESIVDYFLFKNNSPEAFDTIYSYLEKNSMITDADLKPYTELYNSNHGITPNNRNQIDYVIEMETNNPNKNLSASIKKFKASSDKQPNKLKEVIYNGYNKTPEQVIDETPKFFDIFRYFAVVGTIAINPILGLITFFTDQFIKRSYRRPEAEKMINKYQKEIDKIDKKIKDADSDAKKTRLKEYKKTLENNMYKLQNYEEELYSDEENEKREEERISKMSSSDSDFDFNFDFDEAAAITQMIETVTNTDTAMLENIIWKNLSMIVKYDILDEITDFAIMSDGFISKSRLKSICETKYYKIKNDTNIKTLDRYVFLDTLKTNIDKLNNSISEVGIEDESLLEINKITGIYMFIEAMNTLNANSSSPYFLEVSFNNVFNIVKNKLQEIITTLSDKEKEICRNIDTSLGNFKNKVEKCMNSGAREQVLKGSVLPSASKILKMALAGGLVSWLVHPVVAVIGLLGYIGVSKATENKERQLILDEIDTELEMVDRYITAAEQRDDLKAIKNLLTTKKKLQRERLRIKYKMKQHGEIPDRLKNVK